MWENLLAQTWELIRKLLVNWHMFWIMVIAILIGVNIFISVWIAFPSHENRDLIWTQFLLALITSGVAYAVGRMSHRWNVMEHFKHWF